MFPSLNTQSAQPQQANPAIVNGFAAHDEQNNAFFDLRGTLAELVVRELSPKEFRAALEQFSGRFA